MPGSGLNILHTLFQLAFSVMLKGKYFHAYFTNGETDLAVDLKFVLSDPHALATKCLA